MIFVDPYGDVYPCMLVRDPESKIGEVSEERGLVLFKRNPEKLESFDRTTCFAQKMAMDKLH